MIECDICIHNSTNGQCMRGRRGLECEFKPDDKKVIAYAERRGVSVIEAIELLKFVLSYEK